MRVLFLGGTAFTGPHAVRELVAHDHEVTVFHRGESESELLSTVLHVHGDVAHFEEYVDELRMLSPEVVVDTLAFMPEDCRRLLAFKGVARPGVVVSSCDVYRAYGRARGTEPGPLEPVPLTEDSPLREIVVDEDYDKVGVEREAAADPDFPVTILRYPAVYGPGDRQHRLYGYVRRMDDGRPVILLEETHAGWRWVRGYAEDVGHALALAVESEQAAGRVYNVGAPVAHTEAEWVRKIGDVVGWDGRVVVARADLLPESLRPAVDFTQHYDVDSSRIRSELGYAELVDERTALERTVAWERASPLSDASPDYAAEDEALAALTA